MRELARLLILVAVLCSGAVGAKEKEIGFHLPTYPQTDEKLGVTQYYLFYYAFEQLSPEAKGNCNFSYHPDGQLYIHGEDHEVDKCTIAFGAALHALSGGQLTPETFKESKEAYLNYLKDEGHEEHLSVANEIEYQTAVSNVQSLFPLPIMMQSMLPDMVHWDGGPKVDGSVELIDASPELYYALELSQEDKDHISKLITQLGDLGWFALWKDRKEMRKLGKKIKPVHPLRFMGHILSDNHLKKRMPKIMGDFFKKKSFLYGETEEEGFGQRMSRELQQGNMMQYVPGFAEQVGVSKESIFIYFKTHNWEGLIRHLM